MHPELEPVWTRIAAELRGAVDESTWRIWLAPLAPLELTGDVLVLRAPDELREHLGTRYARVLQTCAAAVLGPAAVVELVGERAATEAPVEAGPREAAGGFNPKLTFDQFVIGDANRMAHAAALAVAENPSQAYNPLFLFGAPGLGKTHLLHSVGNYLRAHAPGLTVRYTTTEEFTNGFVDAIQQRAVDRFTRRFRRADVLLIDDVQFLESKAKTEEAFFHLFNALHSTGRQLVLTSDRPPADLAALEDRLRERFAAGLVADLRPPDLSMRLTILRKRALHDGIPLDDPAALEVIAERITRNIRELEGALIRVVAYASLERAPISAELAARVLDRLYPRSADPTRPVRRSVRDVQLAACEVFGVGLDQLCSPGRTARLAFARQVAMYVAREQTDATLPTIGAAFGGRNHTTVMHACRRTAARIADDPEALAAVERVLELLRRPEEDGR